MDQASSGSYDISGSCGWQERPSWGHFSSYRFVPGSNDYEVMPAVARSVDEPPAGRQSAGGGYDAFISYSQYASGEPQPKVCA